MIDAMNRMQEIRKRIEEIQQLGKGQNLSAASSASESKTEPAKGDPQSNEAFSLALEQAIGSLISSGDVSGLGSGGVLSSSDVGNVTNLIQKLGGTQADIDPALVAKAIEQYKSR